MKVHIFLIPYDSGHRSLRMGAGPEHFINNGLAQHLQRAGHDVSVQTLEADPDFRSEVKTQFELYGSLARRVAEAKRNGEFPLVLSGNCGATLGVIAGADVERLGVIWFDTHGEFNTPETTTSGFLDGMGLAIATGRCWQKLAAAIPGFRPISGTKILLFGGHDFDAGERKRLAEAGVGVTDAAAIEQRGIRAALDSTLPAFRDAVEEAHLHIDLDVLNPGEGPANGFVTEDIGLRISEMLEAIDQIKESVKITSATIASYDPHYDPQGKTLGASLKFIERIVHPKARSSNEQRA